MLLKRSQLYAARAALVQQSLAKEVVIWKHGILVLPPIIHDTVACMQARIQAHCDLSAALACP